MTQTVEPIYKTEYDKLFIGGEWVEPSTSDVIEVFSPATGKKVGQVPLAAKADVDAACAAARKAFDEGPWPRMSPTERQAVIAKATALIEERADEFKQPADAGDRSAADDRRHDAVRRRHVDAAVLCLRRPTSSPGRTSATASTARPWCCGNRSVSSARSSPGTCRSSWPPTSWARRSWPAAPSCSSRPPKPR